VSSQNERVVTGRGTPGVRGALCPARMNALRRAGGRQGCEEPCVQPE
jgi:hypothetical protein